MAFSRPPVTAPDATFSAAGTAAWNAGYGVAGADVAGVTYCDTATSEKTSANFLYTEPSSVPTLQVGLSSGVVRIGDMYVRRSGTNLVTIDSDGAGTGDGWTFGQFPSSAGYSGMWASGVTPSTTNYRIGTSGSNNTVVNAPSATGLIYITQAGNVHSVFGGAAGTGLAITAGTAASAVSALSLTQTWNYNSAAINAVDWTFTDTSSHASTNAFRIRGGAAGATALFNVTKAGQANAVSYAVGGVAGASFGPGAVASITVVNGIITAIS